MSVIKHEQVRETNVTRQRGSAQTSVNEGPIIWCGWVVGISTNEPAQMGANEHEQVRRSNKCDQVVVISTNKHKTEWAQMSMRNQGGVTDMNDKHEPPTPPSSWIQVGTGQEQVDVCECKHKWGWAQTTTDKGGCKWWMANTPNTLRVGANEGRCLQTRTVDIAVAWKNEVGVDNWGALLPTHFSTPCETHGPCQFIMRCSECADEKWKGKLNKDYQLQCF